MRGILSLLVVAVIVLDIVGAQCPPLTTRKKCKESPEGDHTISRNCPVCDKYNNNYECEYECNPGYRIFGEENSVTTESILCKNRKWSPRPTCERVVCGVPDDGTNTIDVPDTITGLYEETYTYTCECGYEYDGDMTSVCQANGTWSLEPPTCVATTCGVPVNGTNTVPVPNDTMDNVGDDYVYACEEGFAIADMSDLVSTCLLSGDWSADADPPNCTDIDECESAAADCGELQECVNTIGGFECSCDPLDGGDINTELALGQTVAMSSLRSGASGFTFEGEHVVDGIIDPTEETPVLSQFDSLAETDVDVSPWMQIDLGSSHCVNALVAYSRTGDIRLENGLVNVGADEAAVETEGLNTAVTCVHVPGVADQVQAYNCTERKFGQFVRLIALNINTRLSLWEIMIHGW